MEKKKITHLDSFNELMLSRLYRPLLEFHGDKSSVQVFIAEEIFKNGVPDDTAYYVYKRMRDSITICRESENDVVYYGDSYEWCGGDFTLRLTYRRVFVENEKVFHFQAFVYAYQEGDEAYRELEYPHFDIGATNNGVRAYLKDHFNAVFYPYDSRSNYDQTRKR